MIAELKIFQDCTSEEPIRVYKLNRVSINVARKLRNIKVEGEGEDAQFNAMFELLKTLFPNFIKDDLYLLDLIEYRDFVNKVGKAIKGIEEEAIKN